MKKKKMFFRVGAHLYGAVELGGEKEKADGDPLDLEGDNPHHHFLLGGGGSTHLYMGGRVRSEGTSIVFST